MKTILIAAAIVRDEAGRFLLVRKRGSEFFFSLAARSMQASSLKQPLSAKSRKSLAFALTRTS